MQRIDMEFNDIDSTCIDIFNEFKHLSMSDIRKAVRKGSLGEYGKTFKLSTQEVCFWIREYEKSISVKLKL